MLDKKWSAVVRQQRKIMELEKKIKVRARGALIVSPAQRGVSATSERRAPRQVLEEELKNGGGGGGGAAQTMGGGRGRGQLLPALVPEHKCAGHRDDVTVVKFHPVSVQAAKWRGASGRTRNPTVACRVPVR